MMESKSNDLAHLVRLFCWHSDVHHSSIDVIAAFAKFGRLIYYFVLCED